MKVNLDISNQQQKIFFCSDYHFFHINVIAFDQRPFLFDSSIGYPSDLRDKSNLDIETMNQTLIDNWNQVVGDNDLVFYLGDLSNRGQKATQEITNQLKGKIYFVLGNHDQYKMINSLNRFEMIADYISLNVKYGKKPQERIQICLFHYPISNWDRQHYGSWHLHGHSHQMKVKHDPQYYQQKVLDIGCNGWDYTPVDFWEIKEIMETK